MSKTISVVVESCFYCPFYEFVYRQSFNEETGMFEDRSHQYCLRLTKLGKTSRIEDSNKIHPECPF